MKILLEAHSLLPPRTGVGYTTMNILQGLSKNPSISEVHLLFSMFPTNPGRKTIQQELQNAGLDHQVVCHKWPIPYGWLLRCWYSIHWPRIDQWIPGMDLVHGPAHVLPPASTPSKLLTVHDLTLIEHPDWYPQSARTLRKALMKGIQQADHLLVVSHHIKKKLQQTFSLDPNIIHVNYHPITSNYLIYSPKEKRILREKYFGGDEPYLVWIGEINPRKNLDLLIPVLRWLKEHVNKNIHLLIIGGMGYQGKKILHTISEQGLTYAFMNNSSQHFTDVLFTGYLEESQKKQLLAAAELMIYPSLEEGFGIPVLEAMASGIPVIASNGGALPEIVGNKGIVLELKEGWKPFAEAAMNLFVDELLYHKYKHFGLERIKQFSQEQFLSTLFQVYNSCTQTKT